MDEQELGEMMIYANLAIGVWGGLELLSFSVPASPVTSPGTVEGTPRDTGAHIFYVLVTDINRAFLVVISA